LRPGIYWGNKVLRKLFAFAVLFAASATPASAAWQEARTPHFVIYSEQTAAELNEFATRLEKYDASVRFARGMPDLRLSDSGKLRVYVLRDQQTVARMAGAEDSGVAGFYLANLAGARAFVYREGKAEKDFGMTPEVVFFHEYFHHLMLGYTEAALPHWVVEGYAEFFSTASFESDGSVMLGRPANHRAYTLFMLSDLSLGKMLGDAYKELSGAEMLMVYSRGWLLTHYLAFEPSRQGQLDRYLALIQQGQPGLAAAQSAFGDLRQLNRELSAYIKRKSLPGLRVPKDKVPSPVPQIRPLTGGEAAIMPVLARIERRDRLSPGDAVKIADDAARIAARWPRDGFVAGIHARAEVAAGRDVAAVAAADRALTIDPDSVPALIAKARAQMRLAAAAPRAADWAATRGLLLKANRVDTENAEPLALFYQTFSAAGEVPSANATKALHYARVLIPQDDELRLLAARQLVSDGKFADARTTLAPLAYDPHSKSKELSANAMTAVTAQDRAASLNAIDALLRKLKEVRRG
jgi:hypothetical protein